MSLFTMGNRCQSLIFTVSVFSGMDLRFYLNSETNKEQLNTFIFRKDGLQTGMNHMYLLLWAYQLSRMAKHGSLRPPYKPQQTLAYQQMFNCKFNLSSLKPLFNCPFHLVNKQLFFFFQKYSRCYSRSFYEQGVANLILLQWEISIKSHLCSHVTVLKQLGQSTCPWFSSIRTANDGINKDAKGKP